VMGVTKRRGDLETLETGGTRRQRELEAEGLGDRGTRRQRDLGTGRIKERKRMRKERKKQNTVGRK
jgi:hypothetical protein